MRFAGLRTLSSLVEGKEPGPRRRAPSCAGASTTARFGELAIDVARRGGDGPARRGRVRDERVAGHVPREPRGHDLLGHERDPAQHRRRARPRAARGSPVRPRRWARDAGSARDASRSSPARAAASGGARPSSSPARARGSSSTTSAPRSTARAARPGPRARWSTRSAPSAARRSRTARTCRTTRGRAGSSTAAIEAFGGLDVLVNNAGILRDRMLVNMTIEEWDAVIRVHLRGTFAPTRWAAAYWRDRAKAGERNDARIINTSSSSGIYGNVGQTNYGAAKAGIASFTIIASMELARYGVTVNALAPGARTRMTESLIAARGGGRPRARRVRPAVARQRRADRRVAREHRVGRGHRARVQRRGRSASASRRAGTRAPSSTTGRAGTQRSSARSCSTSLRAHRATP